jgi:hypothetical protein
VAFSVRDRFGIIVLRIRLSRVPFGERANTILENAARDLADRSPTFLGKALDCLEGITINTGCDPLSAPIVRRFRHALAPSESVCAVSAKAARSSTHSTFAPASIQKPSGSEF